MRDRQILVPLAAFGTMLLCGCNQAPVAPPDTRAQDEKTIRDMDAQWTVNYRAKDADKLVSAYYADDASYLDQGKPIVTGKDAIRKAISEELGDPTATTDCSISKVDVSRSGDMAYIQGVCSGAFTDPKTKQLMMEKDKYVVVFKKQADGSWKAVEDISNTDEPPSPKK